MTDSDKSVLRLAIMQLHEIRKNYINGLVEHSKKY